MKSMKEFCKDHKNKFIVAGYVVSVAIIGALVYKQSTTKEVISPYEGMNVLSWIPTTAFMDLERVKEILDLNANNVESFAIFKEGIDPDVYNCILISDNVIIRKSEEA